MAGIRVEVGRAKRNVENLTSFLKTKRYLRTLREDVVADFQRNIRDGKSGDNPMKPLSAFTRNIGRRKGSDKPLRDTGGLMNSIHPINTSRGFNVVTDKPYDVVHQFGATINVTKKMRNFFGWKWGVWLKKSVIKIPARPFMVLSKSTKTLINAYGSKFEKEIVK